MMCLSVSWTRLFFLIDLCLESSPRSARLPLYLVISRDRKAWSCTLFTCFLLGNCNLSGVSCHPTECVIPVEDLHPSLNLHTLDCLSVSTECVDPISCLSTCLTSSSCVVSPYFHGAYHMLEVRRTLRCLTGLSGWGGRVNHLRRATCE